MVFSKKRKITILIVIAIVIIVIYYFLNHYPIGTFKYSKQNNKDLNIQISISERLGTFQEAVYNMHVTIEQNGKIYTKYYVTSDNVIFFGLLSRNKKEFIVFNDIWKGYSKCENGNCSDFFITSIFI